MLENYLNKIFCKDATELVKELPENSIDAFISDPPYGLSIAGNKWDDEIPSLQFFKELMRVMKPGANLLVFGGRRTFHRLACNLEDAGFIFKDSIMWLFISGMPVGKKITNEYATQLKPAWEPILYFSKKHEINYNYNLEKYKVAGLNIKDCRLAFENEEELETFKIKSNRNGYKKYGGKNMFNSKTQHMKAEEYNKIYFESVKDGRWPANLILDENMANEFAEKAKYFFCTKACESERTINDNCYNNHPTLKPIRLMEYLCKLVKTPYRSVILDTFAGSFTTAVAARMTNQDFICCDLSEEFCEIGRERLKVGTLFEECVNA